MILLEILHLIHDLLEYRRAVLGRIAVLDEADLELVTHILVVQPVGKGGFHIDDLLL